MLVVEEERKGIQEVLEVVEGVLEALQLLVVEELLVALVDGVKLVIGVVDVVKHIVSGVGGVVADVNHAHNGKNIEVVHIQIRPVVDLVEREEMVDLVEDIII